MFCVGVKCGKYRAGKCGQPENDEGEPDYCAIHKDAPQSQKEQERVEL